MGSSLSPAASPGGGLSIEEAVARIIERRSPPAARARPALIFGGLAGLLALLFSALLAPAIGGAIPETDNWWMLPTFSHYIEGQGPLGLFRFILSHSPQYFRPPVLKALIWLLDDFLRFPYRCFPAAGAVMHLLNAVLLAGLCRRMGLSWRIAAAAGFTFLSLFLHFHAYLWLPASQHPYSVTTLLAAFWLFRETEARVRSSRAWQGTYLAAGIAALLGSLQHSGAIALPLMICSVFCVPGLTPEQRRRAYRRWLPVWLLFLVYPIWAMAFFGDNTVISAVAKVPLPPAAKAAGLLAAAWAALLLLPATMSFRWLRSRIFWAAAAAAVWLLLAARDSRQLLLPYNAVVPFATILGSFLDPFHAALSMDSADPYYYIPAQISPLTLGLSGLLLGVFLLGFVRRKKGLAAWAVWYGVALFYLLVHKHVASSMPFRTQSRYFLYFTPVFSVVFACGLGLCVSALCRWVGWRRRRDLLLAGILLSLCIPNLLAIRVALARGRLVNTYFVYDDLRAATLIAEDLGRRPGKEQVVRVEGLASLRFGKKWSVPVDPTKVQYENFRRILRDRIGAGREITVPGEGRLVGRDELRYRLEGAQVFTPDGEPLDRFEADFSRGWDLLARGEDAEARRSLLAAARERPFLINYVMGASPLTDAEIITGGTDLQDWVDGMGRRYRRWSIVPVEKWRRVSRLMGQELADYRLCLFALSHLEARAGNAEASRFWLSQIHPIEREPQRAFHLISEDPRVQGPLLEHARRLLDPDSFLDPLPWRRNDYAFGRFLLRALWGIDLRSRWERATGGAA